jgi:hypothetical protein
MGVVVSMYVVRIGKDVCTCLRCMISAYLLLIVGYEIHEHKADIMQYIATPTDRPVN